MRTAQRSYRGRIYAFPGLRPEKVAPAGQSCRSRPRPAIPSGGQSPLLQKTERRKSSLFRSIDRHRTLTTRPMSRIDAWKMIKRRAKAIGLPEEICNHTFRATGITAYLENSGTIEHAQQIANHESPKTTKLYDRTSDQITLDEVERILI